jgi:hypothetical protein
MRLYLIILTHFGAHALSLGSLERGELLKGTIVGYHRNEQTGKFKLFVRVPVERRLCASLLRAGSGRGSSHALR